MLSIQEITSKYAEQLKNVRKTMDATRTFHPEDASIYTGLNLADRYAVHETLRSITVRQLLEFLGKGTTLGNYLVADKVHDDLVYVANQVDLAPLINAQVVNGWDGGDLIVNVIDDESLQPNFTVSGAANPIDTANATKCTLTPQAFTLDAPIASDLEEDTGYALLDWHVAQAAKAVGRFSNNLMLNALKSGSDGVGTANTEAAAADETNWLDIQNGYEANGRDLWNSDTMIVTHEAWTHSITAGTTAATADTYFWGPRVQFTPPAAGFDGKFEMLDLKFCTSPELHLSTDALGAAMTKCVTLVFNRGAALLTGRKRWMQLERYADPVRDLQHAVVSCRQDSVSLYKDATCTITEA